MRRSSVGLGLGSGLGLGFGLVNDVEASDLRHAAVQLRVDEAVREPVVVCTFDGPAQRRMAPSLMFGPASFLRPSHTLSSDTGG